MEIICHERHWKVWPRIISKYNSAREDIGDERTSGVCYVIKEELEEQVAPYMELLHLYSQTVPVLMFILFLTVQFTVSSNKV